MSFHIVTFSSLAELALSDHPLRQKCPEVVLENDDVRGMADKLRAALRAETIAVGFAGPQIGIPRRIAIINHKKKTLEHERLLINPEILEFNAEPDSKYESCMSLPGLRAVLPRPSRVVVRYLTEDWKTETLEAEGFLARIVFHEVDHLNGIMFTDHLHSLDTLEPMQVKES